eukprot:8401995-Karenia_brevis.AAC.1
MREEFISLLPDACKPGAKAQSKGQNSWTAHGPEGGGIQVNLSKRHFWIVAFKDGMLEGKRGFAWYGVTKEKIACAWAKAKKDAWGEEMGLKIYA